MIIPFREELETRAGFPCRAFRWTFQINLSFRFGPDHLWWDGPHCSFSLGPITIQWNNPGCKKCLGEQ